MGRPSGGMLKYPTLAEFEEKVDEYFTMCQNDDRPRTVPSLAVHLGIRVDTLMKYGARDRYGDVVLDALDKIEAWQSEACFDPKMVHGAKFNMDIYRGRIQKAGQALLVGGQSQMLDALLERQSVLLSKLPNLAIQPDEIIDVDEAVEEFTFDEEEGQDDL